MSLRTSLKPARTPGKLMLAKRSFPFGMPSIPNYWFQEGKTTGWGWGKDGLLTKISMQWWTTTKCNTYSFKNCSNTSWIAVVFSVKPLTFKCSRSSWPTQPILNRLVLYSLCNRVGSLKWPRLLHHQKIFFVVFLTRCISSEASEHISIFMGLLLGTKKSHWHQFNQSWSTLLLLPESKPELQMLQPSI